MCSVCTFVPFKMLTVGLTYSSVKASSHLSLSLSNQRNVQSSAVHTCTSLHVYWDDISHKNLLSYFLQIFFSSSEEPDDVWVPYYEKFVSTVVHVNQVDCEKLHKGDFYFLLSSSDPGQLTLKYYDSGQVLSYALEPVELPGLWKENWTDQVRQKVKGRFLFLNCIIISNRGIEKRPWRYLMSESRNVSFKQMKGKKFPDCSTLIWYWFLNML